MKRKTRSKAKVSKSAHKPLQGTKIKKLYHYTVFPHLEKIVEDGSIKPRILIDGSEYPEDHYVWLSTDSNWERTVKKGYHYDENGTPVLGDMADTERLGLARIEVDPSLRFIKWKGFVRHSRIRIKDARLLRNLGNSHQWRCYFGPIKIENWIKIEQLIDSKWVEMRP
jgi:hypothetical protein